MHNVISRPFKIRFSWAAKTWLWTILHKKMGKKDPKRHIKGYKNNIQKHVKMRNIFDFASLCVHIFRFCENSANIFRGCISADPDVCCSGN